VIGDRNFSFTLSYQRKFDFNRAIDVFIDDAVPGITRQLSGKFDQSGGLGSLTPSLAMEITPTFALGASLNVWRSSPFGQNDFTVDTVISDRQVFDTFPNLNLDQTYVTRESYSDLEGENLTLGALWNVTPKWNLGLRIETGFKADVDYELNQQLIDNTTGSVIGTTNIKQNQVVSFPWTYTIGSAYRVNDKLTLALDASFTDYNDFYIKDAFGVKTSLVDGTTIGDPVKGTHFDTTQTYRFGVEYVMIPDNPGTELDTLWTLRGGLFYDEEPASGRPKDNPNTKGDGNADAFYGATAGVGLLVKQRVNFDVAYQFRYGHGVRSDTVGGVGIPGYEENITQHRIVVSSVIYLGGWNRSKGERDYAQERMN
jgi:long-subunit fatty acid transport protein